MVKPFAQALSALREGDQLEDYKIVRDALKVDVWGQVGTANDVQGISDRIPADACAPGVFVKIR